jgi:hypothetical protein
MLRIVRADLQQVRAVGESTRVAGANWLGPALVAASLTALLFLPYFLACQTARPGAVFTGLIMNPEDSQSYFAKMLQGYDGAWRYRIPFTPEAHEPAFVGGFYLALGHAARVTGMSLEAIWHLARGLAGFGLFVVAYGFIASFLQRHGERWLAYLLAVTGSGLGWLLFLLGQPYWLDTFPVDFRMPEAHLFFTAMTFPHVAVGSLLLLLSFRWLARGLNLQAPSWRHGLAAGGANLLLAIVYPFLIYLVLLGSALYLGLQLARERRDRWAAQLRGILAPGLLAFVPPAPLVLTYAWVLRTNPVYRAWDAQAGTPSPPWPHYLLAYAPYLLLGALALWQARRPAGTVSGDADSGEWLILWAWLLAVALLVYAPLPAQRRFVQGAQVPLAMVATVGWTRVALPWLAQRRLVQRLAARPRYSVAGLQRLATVLLVVLLALSNVYVFASVSFSNVVQQPDLLFRTTAEMDAVRWLREQGERGGVVLGSYQTGNLVAARAGNPVFIGHWAETVDFAEKEELVARFFDAATADSWRQEMLADYDVRYVWWGPREQALGDFRADESKYLRPVYENQVVILAVASE